MTLLTGRMPKKLVGIIGGMGPQATADLFSKIIKLSPAQKDQEHIHIIIDNFAQIPDRTGFLLGGGENPLPYLLNSAKRLKNAGAEILAMPCNTAHYFLPQIQKEIGIPFISIIESAAAELKEKFPKAQNVVLLASLGTKKTQIYDKILIKNGFNLLNLDAELDGEIMTAIYDGVKKGKTDEFIPAFENTVNKIIFKYKPDIFISACTEIPILMEKIVCEIPAIDATSALAAAVVKAAY
jgi:aspartate racemase